LSEKSNDPVNHKERNNEEESNENMMQVSWNHFV